MGLGGIISFEIGLSQGVWAASSGLAMLVRKWNLI